MNIHRLQHLTLIAAMGMLAGLAPVGAATGTISADPNPCFIPPGVHECTTFVSWSTEGTRNAKVYVRAEGAKDTPEREFAAKLACDRCSASWIAPRTRYIFTLVEFTPAGRGAVLGSVTVTGAEGNEAPRSGEVTGMIRAEPNPCRIEPGRVECTTWLSWSSTGTHARVYLRTEGAKNIPEKEFGTGRVQEHASASWIGADTRYIFTLVDFSNGSRGRELASVVVTAIK
ncbi:MAG: hypothetical protein ACLP59_16845 [Bryobacteraceae bacterium]